MRRTGNTLDYQAIRKKLDPFQGNMTLEKPCEKTTSGKHHWETEITLYTPPVPLDYPTCMYCGMIDDRPVKGKK